MSDILSLMEKDLQGTNTPTSQSSILDKMQADLQAGNNPAPVVSEQPKENSLFSGSLGGQLSDTASAFGHHLMNLPHGIAQLVENGVDYGAQKLPDNPISRAIHNTVQSDNAGMAQREQEYQANTPNSAGSYVGATAGEIAPFAATAVGRAVKGVGDIGANIASKMLPEGVPKIIPQMAGGAAQGALVGAAQPVTSGDYGTEKTKQMQIGALGGGLAPPVIQGAANVINPVLSPAYNALKQAGVNTTIGQRLGGAYNTIEEKSQSLPIVGDMISKARGNALKSWNEATLNDVVKPLGATVTQTGHDGVAQAGDIVSEAYNQGKKMLGGFQVDPTASQALKDLSTGVNNATNLTDQGKKAFSQALGLVKQQISPNGSILADGYKEIDSKLGQEASSYLGSTDAYQKNLGNALKQLNSIVTDNAKRANPQAAQILDNADTAWAKLVRVEGAAKMAAGNKVNTGIFTPSQLMSAVRANDSSVRDRATARGEAYMQDWAQNGLKVLGDKVPNSGTFDRGINGAALVGLGASPGYAIPAGIGIGIGSAAYTKPMQKLAVKLATDRPQGAAMLADALRKYIPSP